MPAQFCDTDSKINRSWGTCLSKIGTGSRALLLCLCLLPLVCAPLRAEPGYITFPSDISWMTRRSAHFEILYREGEAAFAERALLAAEKAHRLLAPIFPETPERTYVVLADFKDGLNGYAIDFPYPHMVIFGSPPEGSSTLSVLDDWLESVILHEYVHVLHLYPATGLWSAGRAVFGSWVLPNGLMPSHLHEGLAVFLETQMGTSGRGQGADFRMYRRMAVKEGKWGGDFAPMDLFEGSVRHWPHGHSPYFFGYWAWKEVWDRKQAEGIKEVVRGQSGNWPYWISRPFEKELGLTYPDLWKAVFEKGGKEASKEIADIEKAGVTAYKFITDSRYNKWDLASSPDNQLLAMRTSEPEQGTRIEIRKAIDGSLVDYFEPDSGSEQGMCLAIRNGKTHLVYTDSKLDNGYQTFILKHYVVEDKYRGLFPLKESTEKHKNTVEHVHALSCSPDLTSLAVYVEHAGHGRVMRLTATDEALELQDGALPHYVVSQAWNIPTASWISGILVGKNILGILRDHTGSSLYEWSGNSSRKVGQISRQHFHTLFNDPAGKLVAIGAAEGRNELWELSAVNGAPRKRISVLGGLAGAAYARNSELFGLNYRHGGYDLAVFDSSSIKSDGPSPRPLPVVIERVPSSTVAGTNARGEVSDATQLLLEPEKPYSPWGSLWPRAWIPNVLVVPNGMQVSAWIPGFDIGQKNSYSLFGGYDTRGSLFVSGSYGYRFQKASVAQAEAYFTPSYLISSRSFLKSWGGSVGLSTSLGFIDPRFSFTLQFRKLEGGATYSEKQSVGVGISSSHAFGFKSRPRAIAPRRGTRLSASYSQFFTEMGSTDPYYTFTASGDQYMSSPWLASHVFYLGARFGQTDGTVIYNSYFQGGGELIFSQGRGFFMNRGFVPGSFLGRRMLSLNMEYRFPIWDVYRGSGLMPAFLQRIHAALIADVLTFDYGLKSVNPRDFFKVYYGSIGVELKTDWKLFYYLPALIRLGVYRGIGQNRYYGAVGEPIYVTFAMEGGLF